MRYQIGAAERRHILSAEKLAGQGAPDGAPARFSCDVCVIGSGAGGSVVAKELAEAGATVVLVERGPWIETGELGFRFLESGVRLSRIHFTRGRRVSLNQGSVLGGGTFHFVGGAETAPAVALRDWRETSGLPFDEGMLDEQYDATGEVMEATPQPESLGNRNNLLVRDMAEALARGDGLRGKRRFTSGCAGAGMCVLGCAYGLKAHMVNTYLPLGLRTGRLTILTETEVLGIEGTLVPDDGRSGGPTGHAVEVRGRAASGRVDPTAGRGPVPPARDVIVRPRAVVVAAGAVASSALLLRCDFIRRRDNIGRDVRLQPHAQLYALFDDPVGEPPGVLPDGQVVHGGVPSIYNFDAFLASDRFAWHAATLLPAAFALYLRHFPPAEHAWFMERFRRVATVNLTLRDAPVRARVSADRDFQLDYLESAADRRNLAHGMLTAARAYFRVGARAVLLPLKEPRVVRRESELAALEAHDWPYDELLVFSDQLNGGNRMAVDRERGAVDRSGKVFDTDNVYVADGSLFPDSIGVSPSWTIMSLARQVAGAIATELGVRPVSSHQA